MKHWIVAAHVSLALPAIAMDARHPDWPCPQIVVPKLSVAAFWTGPSIDDVGDAWTKDQTVQDLVLRLAGRRTPLPEAEKGAAQFIVGTEAERQQNGKLLFAGLFATLSRERDDVMAGIERSRNGSSSCANRSAQSYRTCDPVRTHQIRMRPRSRSSGIR